MANKVCKAAALRATVFRYPRKTAGGVLNTTTPPIRARVNSVFWRMSRQRVSFVRVLYLYSVVYTSVGKELQFLVTNVLSHNSGYRDVCASIYYFLTFPEKRILK